MSTGTQDTTRVWEQLSTHIETFVKAWEQHPPAPNLADHLPPEPTLRGVATVELIKIDFEHRHLKGEWWPLEKYMELFPEILRDGEPPCDLIYEEYHTRKSRGEQPDPEEYFRRFRHSRPALERLLNCYDSNQTMSIAAGRPKVQFTPGDILDDFVLLAKLGSGAFASVFLARQQSMQRLVALKISADKGNEPQTLAQLDHPHIVRVYDQRRLPEQQVRLLYMQYAPGGTLHEVIERVRRTLPQDRNGRVLIDTVNASLDAAGYPQPEDSSNRRRMSAASWPEIVCRMGIQLAQALEFAHKRGVLHRDVKPANVLITAECTPKLADFNISFCSQLEGASPAAYFGGSLAYMSPEQLEACNPEHAREPDSLDRRSDLFSLAAMLWEMLYGVRAFREGDLSPHWSQMLTELVKRRKEETPTPPYQATDPLTIELTQVLSRGLSPNLEERPTDGTAFARELILCLQPKSRMLLQLPSLGWRHFARQWPMFCTIMVVLVPNGLAGFFNYTYNRGIIAALPDHVAALNAFHVVQLTLNAFYFSLGALIARFIIYPTANAVALSEQPGALKPTDAIVARLRAVNFGNIAAAVGVGLWLSSGIAFPLGIQWMYPAMPFTVYYHFLASMTICGLIAAAYPFFGFTMLLTRVFYPALLRIAPGIDADEERLSQLARNTTPYLLTAGVVPLASMLMVVLTTVDTNRNVILSLIVAGLLGLVFAFSLYQRIRDDISALLIAVRPLDVANTDSESRSVY